ncbi:hypothetical protein [Rhodococcus qingshengii]|uniref:hypothetical protein n=1 Tax=Rhodococcus qingshengii TaxID=334542 RepID=UPI0035F675B7
MSTETVIDIISTGVVIGVPWHRSETVIDVISTATVGASVTIDTESLVDVVSETIQIIDVVNSETIVDIVSGTTVKPSPTVGTNTVVDIASTSSVTPSPTINTETVIDIVSAAVVLPSPTTAGETIVDITSTSTVAPSPTVTTNTVIDILSEGTITSGPVVAAYTTGSGKDNWVVTLPPAATGDLRIIIIGLVAKSSSARAGWVKLGEDSSWYEPGIAVHYRVRRALDPDTVTLDVGGYGSASTVVAMTIPGAMIPTIFGTAKNYSSTAPSPHTTPAITTTKAYSLAIRAVIGNPPTPSAPTYLTWGSPMAELAQVQSVPADSTGDNGVMTVATGSASVVGVQPAVNVVPSISMPYMGAAFAIEPMTIIAGMHLTTQHNLVSSGTQTQIAGWSADQGSTVTSDRLVIPVTKTGANVEVFLRYQTNSAIGTPSLQWRLLKNAAATQLTSQTVSGGGVGTNYEVVMTYSGNFVAGDYLYLTCAGTFTAPAPFVIPGVDTFVRVT